VETVRQIITALCDAAPPGRGCPGEQALPRLRVLTRALLAANPAAEGEYARFLAIRDRGLGLPEPALASWLGGSSVLVTGGTGCVGSELMRQLAAYGPRRLASVSRGITAGWPRQPGAEYFQADIRDLPALAAVLADTAPDVVFHVAAQRDPGRAEREVHHTVTTNVLGTQNVLTAAGRTGAAQVVYASTGKALRPYSPDVYAASKRAAEWVVSAAAARSGCRYSAARFTHVVDNSIIHRRLLEWSAGGVVRLHAADIVFYAQSALESAQLLLCAGLGARPGNLRVHAITDLGWPVSLLDLALGVLRRTGSAAPLYFSGYDAGYEDVPFPGLYDPLTAGEVSPLLSALETARAERAERPEGFAVDAFPLELAADPELDKLLLALEETCEVTQEPEPVRAALDELSWGLLGAALRAGPATAVERAAARAAVHRDRLGAGHRRVLAAMERHLQRAAGTPG
jgi:nucleoside-diphosphate-sugar epimerase